MALGDVCGERYRLGLESGCAALYCLPFCTLVSCLGLMCSLLDCVYPWSALLGVPAVYVICALSCLPVSVLGVWTVGLPLGWLLSAVNLSILGVCQVLG